MIRVEIPLKLPSTANLREHWAARARRAAEQRSAAAWHLRAAGGPPGTYPLPVTVTVTRIARGTLDAHDNLPSACKNVVDGIADWLGVKDNDSRVTWKYSQEKGKLGVRVEVSDGS